MHFGSAEGLVVVALRTVEHEGNDGPTGHFQATFPVSLPEHAGLQGLIRLAIVGTHQGIEGFALTQWTQRQPILPKVIVDRPKGARLELSFLQFTPLCRGRFNGETDHRVCD